MDAAQPEEEEGRDEKNEKAVLFRGLLCYCDLWAFIDSFSSWNAKKQSMDTKISVDMTR